MRFFTSMGREQGTGRLGLSLFSWLTAEPKSCYSLSLEVFEQVEGFSKIRLQFQGFLAVLDCLLLIDETRMSFGNLEKGAESANLPSSEF